MTDWYSSAREADGRTDEEVLASLRYRLDVDPLTIWEDHAPAQADRTFGYLWLLPLTGIVVAVMIYLLYR